MRICLICEGSYPYTVGGVSSWVQQLITLFPQHEFSIYAIGEHRKQQGNYQYKLPENVKLVEEVFLSDALEDSSFRGKTKENLKNWHKEEFGKLFQGEVEHWDSIFDFFARENQIITEFLMGKEFYQIIHDLYIEQFEDTIYTEFLWTMRSMYLTLFHILNHPPAKADIYHAVSTGYAGIAGALGKRTHGGRYIITEHGIYTREREEEIIKASWVSKEFKPLWINYFKNLSKGAYIKADRILALFETNNILQIEMGADSLKCDHIPNGIPVRNYEQLPKKEVSTSFHVGAVIRVSPIKDIKTMLYAFDLVKREIPSAKFFIMGSTEEAPEYYKECLDLLRDLGTADVIFTGRVEVKEYLGKMDVIVLSSISEAQPLALMEAMAAGIPCVSTNVGCVAELFQGGTGDTLGVCGLVAPIMNYEKIAEHILTILKNKELGESYGQVGKKRIEKYYSEERFKTAYEELYTELGEGGGTWLG